MKRDYDFFATPAEERELAAAGVLNGGCVALTCARALADNPEDAAAWIGPVVEALSKVMFWKTEHRFVKATGAWIGKIDDALTACGIEFTEIKIEPEWKRVFRPYSKHAAYSIGRGNDDEWMKTDRAYYPTVTRWMADNPNAIRVAIGTSGHAAFIGRNKAYGVKARYRVETAYLIEGEVG